MVIALKNPHLRLIDVDNAENIKERNMHSSYSTYEWLKISCDLIDQGLAQLQSDLQIVVGKMTDSCIINVKFL